VTEVHEKTSVLPARASGEVAGGPSLIPQTHGGALLGGGVPGHRGANQHTDRQKVAEVRGQLIAQLEGAAKDLSAFLETARESDGDRLRCKNCGSFIPGISKLKLGDILAVIRELRAVLPAQLEHEGVLHHMGVVELPTLTGGGLEVPADIAGDTVMVSFLPAVWELLRRVKVLGWVDAVVEVLEAEGSE